MVIKLIQYRQNKAAKRTWGQKGHPKIRTKRKKRKKTEKTEKTEKNGQNGKNFALMSVQLAWKIRSANRQNAES